MNLKERDEKVSQLITKTLDEINYALAMRDLEAAKIFTSLLDILTVLEKEYAVGRDVREENEPKV